MPMTDTLTITQRSERMSRVGAKDTQPEWRVRSLLHAMGYRYRLHARDLPGRPDIVFRKRRKVIFVHGCFWHRHDDPACRLARLPKSRVDFWEAKLTGNAERDKRVVKVLESSGWQVLIVWECELRDSEHIENKLRHFLDA